MCTNCKFSLQHCINLISGLMIAVLLPGAMQASAQTAVVSTQFGQVQGTRNGSVFQFLGIPFARPPVDSLRWKAPVDPETWSGIRAAQTYSPVCPQPGTAKANEPSATGSEDCLYLNIWTPETDASKRPVMVFIHGGGNQQGGASSGAAGLQLYFGKNLAARGNVVVVTIQYRLGPLGFLVHPGLEVESPGRKAGNYALLDQILALKWVKNNIAAFGGDAGNVMIFGESAGGVDVGDLMISPPAAELFHKACIQSAVPVVSSYIDARLKGIEYVNKLISNGTDEQKISYLRSLPADSLVNYSGDVLPGGVVQMNWQPVADGNVLPGQPDDMLQSGNYNKVPLIIGSNAEEISLSAPATVTPAMVTQLINTFVFAALRERAAALYPPGTDNNQARKSYVNLLTDMQFTLQTRRTAQCVSKNQQEPVWRYLFSYRHSIPQLAEYGSYHGMELFYVFNNWENSLLATGPLFTAQDDSVQKNMLAYWVNFARTGNPNGSNLVDWPQYRSADDPYIELKATPDGSKTGLRKEKCDFWDEAFLYHGCGGVNGITDRAGNNRIAVFPNPATGKIRLLNLPEGEAFSVAVTDIAGRILLSARNTEVIDICNIPPGIYGIIIRTEKSITSRKIIKR